MAGWMDEFGHASDSRNLITSDTLALLRENNSVSYYDQRRPGDPHGPGRR